jgi:hypothetical protein
MPDCPLPPRPLSICDSARNAGIAWHEVADWPTKGTECCLLLPLLLRKETARDRAGRGRKPYYRRAAPGEMQHHCATRSDDGPLVFLPSDSASPGRVIITRHATVCAAVPVTRSRPDCVKKRVNMEHAQNLNNHVLCIWLRLPLLQSSSPSLSSLPQQSHIPNTRNNDVQNGAVTTQLA